LTHNDLQQNIQAILTKITINYNKRASTTKKWLIDISLMHNDLQQNIPTISTKITHDYNKKIFNNEKVVNKHLFDAYWFTTKHTNYFNKKSQAITTKIVMCL
jgi:hypothetical protein